MKARYIIASLMLGSMALSLTGCDDFLESSKPKGILDNEQVFTPENIEGMVISAYAYMVTGEDMNSSFQLWQLGNVRSDDAYKGGANTEDGSHMYYAEIARGLTADLWVFDDLWYRLYCGVNRANDALRSLAGVTEENFPKKKERTAEMRFIRGHFMFKLKELYKYVPVIDENVEENTEAYRQISNRVYTNDELWQKVADDFQYAYDNLPETQPTDKGRPTRAAAAAYLAKTYLFKAYRQDDVRTNEITSMNAADLKKVIELTAADIYAANGNTLEDDYAFNFLPGTYENGRESVWAIQYSQDDGTKYGNLNFAYELTAPQGIGCCDFNKPSQNLVNTFKTDIDGLPAANANAENYDASSDNVDPRLFHTVAMPGFPYKYNVNVDYTEAWARAPQIYGYYASMKENVDKECDCLKKNGPFYANSKNWIVLRYADVLLMRAEAEVELAALGDAAGNLEDARSIVNSLRRRAAQSTTLIFDYPAKYKIGTYNTAWNVDEARRAVRTERRLELAMECGRFFDLVRWGVADEVMNAYYGSEKNRRSYLNDAYFTKNKNEYCPVPQKQINYSNGVYVQNCGWE